MHASTVAFVRDGQAHGLVLAGPSGSGKSSLALELMALGADLVSDDQTELRVDHGKLMATAPHPLGGLIEWRGVGLLPARPLGQAQAVIWVDLGTATTKRLPEPDWKHVLGISLPCLRPQRDGPIAAGLRLFMLEQAWMTHGGQLT